MTGYIGAVVSMLVALVAGGVGSIFTAKEIPSWYAHIAKPSFSPPNWVFGPVWTTLYVLMGIAAWLVYRESLERSDVRMALAVYALQLILNAAWSYIFFGMHDIQLAFLELCVLWIAIAATTLLFYRISPTAAYLLLPYLAWVSFAGLLNFRLWMLNP